MSLADRIEIVPLKKPPQATVKVPGSKSITNRALVLAALSAKGFAFALRGALQSEDTEVMVDCLRKLGFRVLTEWADSSLFVSSGEDETTIPAQEADLYTGNSGTTMRFLTAMTCLGDGRFRLDGNARMRQRPIEDLLAALRQMGAKVHCENGDGCPPVIVEASGLNGGTVKVKGNVSSQFLSALLLVAPYAREPVTIEVEGDLVSRPYVDMTLKMLRLWNLPFLERPAPLQFEFIGGGGRWRDKMYQEQAEAAAFHEGFDPRRHTWLREYDIEPDATAAGYFWGAAAITGGEVTVPGLSEKSLQGDIRFLDVLQEMGCQVNSTKEGMTLKGGPLHGIDVDMNDISDCVMTLAAVACFAEGPTTIRNVAHIRVKESDRIAALATELRRIGAEVEEFSDGLKIIPGPLHGAEIETYDDHRIAMSLAIAGLKIPGIVIKNPACVGKTYPRFFEDLESLR